MLPGFILWRLRVLEFGVLFKSIQPLELYFQSWNRLLLYPVASAAVQLQTMESMDGTPLTLEIFTNVWAKEAFPDGRDDELLVQFMAYDSPLDMLSLMERFV